MEVSRPKATGRLLSFNTQSNNGIKIIDHIERRYCRIDTQYYSLTDIPTEKFHFPVDRCISITTSELSMPYSVAPSIRNHTGIMIDQLSSGDHRDYPLGEYSIELSTPIKLYVASNSKFSIDVSSNEVKISFNNPTEVFIGARSHHKRPAGKIVTPPNPEEMMAAVSQLSSALKTTTCERSYPTLRGHPPEIVIGEELRIPEIVDKKETGVEIEITPDYRSLYVVSPLAYYLGADVVEGESHAITTSRGFRHSLEKTNKPLEYEINRVLKQCFFLDCLVRTEGYYKISLYEREQLEQKIDIDFSALYRQTLSEQIETYLSIPYNIIKPYIPKWKQTAYVETKSDNIEVLPFLIHDLAAIHSERNSGIGRKNIENTEYMTDSSRCVGHAESHYRGKRTPDQNDGRLVGTRSGENSEPEEYIQFPNNESLEQTWVGDGIPIGASKSIISAFKNRLEREPTNDDIGISVVVNDDQMIKEGNAVNEVYKTREKIGLSADVHHHLSKSELHGLLQQDIEFLHYIGHIDENGFECANGQLDATELERVNIDSFFLNACSSYRQAIGLINAGSIAGIATVKPVLNSGAERVGKTVARLLNLGFPLVAALKIAKSESIMGNNYVIIGDGGVDLTQEIGGSPSSCEVTKSENAFDIRFKTYLTRRKGIGSMTIPYVKDNQQYYLTSGDTGRFTVNTDDLLRFFSEESMPVHMDSKLCWSDEITVDEILNDI